MSGIDQDDALVDVVVEIISIVPVDLTGKPVKQSAIKYGLGFEKHFPLTSGILTRVRKVEPHLDGCEIIEKPKVGNPKGQFLCQAVGPIFSLSDRS